MRIGFDYWQVLSHFTDHCHDFIEAMQNAGHDVVCISAVGKKREGTVEAEVRKLGFDIPVHEVVFDSPKQSPALKLAKCQELGIQAFFDDRDDVCRLLNQNGVMAMRVTRLSNTTYDLDGDDDIANELE